MASGGGAGRVEEAKKLKLYSFWRSSCSGRVRIALNLKGLEYEYKAVNLFKGDQFDPEFLKLSPLGYVPVLVDGDLVVVDSFAILMVSWFGNVDQYGIYWDSFKLLENIHLRNINLQYLEEKYPQHPLLPQDIQKRALNYQAANIVASNVQPLQSIPVLKSIEEKLGPDEKLAWAWNHIRKGFGALENLLKDYAGKYATGDDVFLADLFIAPQIHGAIKRFNLDMNEFPLLSRLFQAYLEVPDFRDALPEKQPDTPAEERT